jgi:hypothetical protein
MVRTMYGDLINGVMLSISLPMLLREAFKADESPWVAERNLESYNHHSPSTALYLAERRYLLLPYAVQVPFIICALFAVTLLCSFRAWYTTDRNASFCAFLSLHCISPLLVLYEWPNPGDESIWTHLSWHFLIVTSNVPHSFHVKCILGVLSCCHKVFIVILSPRYTLRDTIPTLLGSTGAYVVDALPRWSSVSQLAFTIQLRSLH